MLIDWLTLRICFSHLMLSEVDFEKFVQFLGTVEYKDKDGNLTNTRYVVDIDNLRSDSKGIFWSITRDGNKSYLNIGGSPASVEFNNNVFGSADIEHCMNLLIQHSKRALSCHLPPASLWDVRRIDITKNYLLDSNTEVKQALRVLRQGDGLRQKATCPKGDSVYWGEGSDYIKGKAYDKGTQAEFLQKKSKSIVFDNYVMSLLKRILRLELSLCRRWFDRTKTHWKDLNQLFLDTQHNKYFSQFIGKEIEVTDMDTSLQQKFIDNAPSRGQGLAAMATWALIKQYGFEHVKELIPQQTLYRHKKIMFSVGLTMADLQAGNVLPFRQKFISLSHPLQSWDDLLAA